MSVHSFELTIDGHLTEERVNALYEAGCRDMTFQGDDQEHDLATAVVHRDAADLVTAVHLAVTNIESVEGLRVLTVLGINDQELMAAINAALQVRLLARHLSEQERQALRTLLIRGAH